MEINSEVVTDGQEKPKRIRRQEVDVNRVNELRSKRGGKLRQS
jgi:hypothetical protein